MLLMVDGIGCMCNAALLTFRCTLCVGYLWREMRTLGAQKEYYLYNMYLLKNIIFSKIHTLGGGYERQKIAAMYKSI